MIVTLQTHALQTLEQVRAFMAGAGPVSFTLTERDLAHAWMGDTLKRFGYARASRADRGLLRRYLAKVTGRSRAQVARRIAQFLEEGQIRDSGAPPLRRLPGAIPTPTSGGWPRRTHCMARCPEASPASCANAPSRCLAMPDLSVWP